MSWRSDYEGKTLSKKAKAQPKKKTPAYTTSIYDNIEIGPGVHWLKVMLFQKTDWISGTHVAPQMCPVNPTGSDTFFWHLRTLHHVMHRHVEAKQPYTYCKILKELHK